MKTLILTLSLFVIPLIGISQLDVKEKTESVKIGEIKIAGHLWISFSEMEGNYLFMFKNIKYTQITDYKYFYFPTKEDCDELYTLILNNIQEPNKDLEIKLSNGDVLTLKFNKKRVEFNLWDGIALSYTAPFNLKQINSLFGKE